MTKDEAVRDIWMQRKALDRQLQQKMNEVAREHRMENEAAYVALRTACEAVCGHDWAFSNIGPTGLAWFHCRHCGASKTE